MEREIKFRAFENENGRNRMFEWEEIKKHFSDYLNCNDTFLMQFTGLKDKNEKDIYEGDIVRGFICFTIKLLKIFHSLWKIWTARIFHSLWKNCAAYLGGTIDSL